MITKSVPVTEQPVEQVAETIKPVFAEFSESAANDLLEQCLAEDAGVGGVSSGAIATTPGLGLGKNVGSLFGGSYKQPKKKKTETIIKRPRVA